MQITNFIKKMEKAGDNIVKADVKCHYCGKITKDAVHFYPMDALQDIRNEVHFEKVTFFDCNTCSNMVRAAVTDCRNFKITDKKLHNVTGMYINRYASQQALQIWQNEEKSILVNPNKIMNGNYYSVGFLEYEHFYLNNGTTSHNNFEKALNVVIDWEMELTFPNAISTRRYGLIISSPEDKTLENKIIELRFNQIYRDYVNVSFWDKIPFI